MSGLKVIKGDNPDNEFVERTITLRGTQYTIRELDVPEYEECLKAATREDGNVPFGDLLKVMTLRAVSPSIAARKRPLPYPIYRTLEGLVNVMHYMDVEDETPAEAGEGETAEEAVAPNA